MSKSVLVIDTPDACIDCPMCFRSDKITIGEFEYKQLHSCRYTPSSEEDVYLEDILRKKPDWCPLKEIPKKKNYGCLSEGSSLVAWGNGWNACIDEIVIET